MLNEARLIDDTDNPETDSGMRVRQGHDAIARKLAWLDNLPEEWQGVWEDIQHRHREATNVG